MKTSSVRSMLLLVALFLVGAGAGITAGVVFGGRGAGSPQSGGPAIEPEPAADAVPAGSLETVTGAALTPENPYAAFRLGDFAFLDRSGASVGPEAFDGAVTVLAYFFTSCSGPCPLLITSMRDIERVTDGTRLRFAAISVDGDRDTPAVLAAYAENAGIGTERWTLLTGAPEAVARLTQESLGYEITLVEDAPIIGPDGASMPDILHPTRLLLIGPDRRAVGVYAYDDPEDVDRLIADARRALAVSD